ncbi:TPA: hypothetical protein L9L67_000717 [Klebsiella quasipneumoniae subsp. quasipneumoniae]|nr:hypothetical protein [Klebsiella quasipneumoniae subsp. quasipneumoniae]HBR1956904.1 hypothetical protein [Klebsiella quasipneumoniae subsp. quasipneumoniae]HEN5125176.1 hypothetical protein [Klebsiella quasipneumoniae]
MNIEQKVDSLINELEQLSSNQVREPIKLRSIYNKEHSDYWEIISKLCKEKARRLK